MRWIVSDVVVNVTIVGDARVLELLQEKAMSASYVVREPMTYEMILGPGCDNGVTPSPIPSPSPFPSPPPTPSPSPSSLYPSPVPSPSPLPSPSPVPPPTPTPRFHIPLILQFVSKNENLERHTVTWTYEIVRESMSHAAQIYYMDLEICQDIVTTSQVCIEFIFFRERRKTNIIC